MFITNNIITSSNSYLDNPQENDLDYKYNY